MKWDNFSRSIAAVAVGVAAIGCAQTASAGWFDSATGQPVHVTPRGGGNAQNDNHATIHDLDGHVTDLYWDQACNTWRSSQTGEEIHVTPRGGGNAQNDNHATIHDLDGHVTDLYWVPCAPPTQSATGNPPPPHSSGLKSKHKHTYSEDDPRFMEDYQPPAEAKSSFDEHRTDEMGRPKRQHAPPFSPTPDGDGNRDGSTPNHPNDKPSDVPAWPPKSDNAVLYDNPGVPH